MKKIIFLYLLLQTFHFSLFTSSLQARPWLYDLNIRVVLTKNGDAHITETRQMEIDSEGTECYIVIGNLNGSSLSDFGVSDETGRTFENIGSWDIDRSRSWKEGKCGIVSKRDGYELCWGLGESGNRTYTTHYTISQLVKGYDDADGFNYMFVAQGINPYPQHVRLTIETAELPDSQNSQNSLNSPNSPNSLNSLNSQNSLTSLTPDNSAIWGFRYRGDVNFVDGRIVAESSEPFSSESAMIVMCRFNKGLFEPEDIRQGSFEEVKERAFEGSDYPVEDDFWPVVVFAILIILGGLIFVGLYLFYIWWQRRKVQKDLLWYRDIPLEGNLQRANDMLNAYKYVTADYNNLLSACILKLINMGAITIESRLNAKGKTEQNFVIKELPNADRQPKLLRMVHRIFKDAAGSDTILEPKELKSWMRSSYNQSYTDSFIQTLHTRTSIYQYKNQIDEVRQVFGLKKFLKEFSLLDERHVNEVSLWKDYMIYATLFGIADQVIKDMKKINPEYFNMDQVAQQMADDMTLPMIYSTMHNSTARAAMSKAEREARASGSGGHSSWGGGGGFSGGGFGGGVR